MRYHFAGSGGRAEMGSVVAFSRVVGTASVALAGAVLMGMTPTVSAAPALLANSSVYFLQGTKIGDTTSHPAPLIFATEMMTGAGEAAPEPDGFHFVDYPATIGPFSSGGFRDPSWGVSVGRGIAALGEQPVAGDTVFGFSQGAVVATAYKRDHLGNGVNYVLVENPGRPNGGIFERFHGLYIPLLNIRFSGATPVVREPETGGGTTVDIARQYDGWADFPKYPLNLLATANAVLGIIYLHGDTQDLDEDAVKDIDKTDPRYYQQHGDTTYYLIPTKRLPLLMPLNGLLPKPVLDQLDGPLRALIELGYDRSDYSKNSPAQILPPIGARTAVPEVATATAVTADEVKPTPVTASPGVAAQPSSKKSSTPQGDATQNDLPKPPRTSLTTKLRQSSVAISSKLRSLTGHKADPKTSDADASQPVSKSSTDEPKKDDHKPADKSDAA